MNIGLPEIIQILNVGSINVKLKSDGTEYPLVRIENADSINQKIYVYSDGGVEVSVNESDAILVKI